MLSEGLKMELEYKQHRLAKLMVTAQEEQSLQKGAKRFRGSMIVNKRAAVRSSRSA
jgi:hypothetical protein